MKIEVGKYYRTRDGRKVGPMKKFVHRFDLGCGIPGVWTEEGLNDYFSWGDEADLIAEWTDGEPAKHDEPAKPGTTLSSETVDRIAIDSLRFHFKGELEPLQREAFRIVLRYYGASV